MHPTLLVPELIWPEPGDERTLGDLAAPGLEWLLARAKLTRKPRRPYEDVLAARLGIDPAPFGALRLLGEGSEEARHGHWLCADPVHLRFHHERIVLADAGAFDLDLNEAHDLVTALNCEFADIGHFYVATARRWYLRLNEPVEHPVPPLSAVAGRRVDDSARGQLPLTRLLNEIQMYLHGHPVNDARQQAGKPAVNSLWLWGGGSLGATPASDHSMLLAGDPLALGLAAAGNLASLALPAGLADLPLQAGTRPLLLVEDLLPGVLYEDGERWRAALEQLDAAWFQPLQKALGRQVDRITLIAPTIYGELHFDIAAGNRWQFWKRPQPFAAIARALADTP